METQDPQIQLNKALSEAADLTEGKSNYVNVVHFGIGASEITLDMYFLGPDTKSVGQNSVQAQHLQRIVMPLAAAKETAQLMLQAIKQWEDTFGVTLPFTPQAQVEKTIMPETDNFDE